MKGLLPVVTFILGLGAGWIFFHQPASEQQEEKTPQVEELQAKIQNIHDVDFQDYLQLKDQKAQFLKANEILSKMMMIFLADLGLRISAKDMQSLKEIPLASSGVQDSASCEIPEAKNAETMNSSRDTLTPGSPPAGPVNTNTQVSKVWKDKEKNIANVSTDSEIENFLKDVVVEDLFSEVKSAGSIRRRDLRNLNGVFEGILNYDKSDEQPAEVYLELEGIFRRGQVKGSSKIILSRNGKPFSNSNSNGDIDGYKKTDSNSPAVFLELGGKSGYFQLYFVRSNSMLIGNYYKQQGLAEFKKSGTVTLYRR